MTGVSKDNCIIIYIHTYVYAYAGGSVVKNLPAKQESQVLSLGPLEKEIATHSSILAWTIPWTEEPDGLPSVGLQRVGHSSVTKPPPPPYARKKKVCF